MKGRVFLKVTKNGDDVVRPYAHNEIRCPGRVYPGAGENICNGKMKFVCVVENSNPLKAIVECNICGIRGTVPVFDKMEAICQQ